MSTSIVMVAVKNETDQPLMVGFYDATSGQTTTELIPNDNAFHQVNLPGSGGYTVGFWTTPGGAFYTPTSGCAAAGNDVISGNSYTVVVSTGGCTFS